MSGESSQQGQTGVHKEHSVDPPRDTPRHVNVIGGEPSGFSPLRWVLVIVPLLLVIVGGVYLLGLWTASLQRAPEQRRAKEQRPVAPQQDARRAPAESGGVDA